MPVGKMQGFFGPSTAEAGKLEQPPSEPMSSRKQAYRTLFPCSKFVAFTIGCLLQSSSCGDKGGSQTQGSVTMPSGQ